MLQDFKRSLADARARRRDAALTRMPRHTPGSDILGGNKVYFNDAASYLQQRNEIFYRGIYHFHPATENPRVLDCGGNMGLSAIFFRQQYPKARVTVFEPDPTIADICAANLKAFGYEKDVELVRKAVWSREETLRFDAKGAAAGRLSADAADVIEVPAIPLRPYLEAEAVIDMVKIDIEGAEMEVLRSVSDLLPRVRNLFVEYHSFVGQPQQLSELLDIVTAAGFRYYLESEVKLSDAPLRDRGTLEGMDAQVMVFCYR